MTPSPHSTFTADTNTPDQGGHLQKTTQPWRDPSSFPKYGDASRISGNAPEFVKQLTNNAFGAYGVGDEECFGHSVGRATKFITIDIADRKDGGRAVLEARIVAEVVVTKGRSW
jgi:acyl-coenzyme A thioesterase 13